MLSRVRSLSCIAIQEFTPSKAVATDTVVGATNGVNTYLGEYTTDNDGKIKAENLPVGKYFFVESLHRQDM